MGSSPKVERVAQPRLRRELAFDLVGAPSSAARSRSSISSARTTTTRTSAYSRGVVARPGPDARATITRRGRGVIVLEGQER